MNNKITKEDLIKKFKTIEGKKIGEIDRYDLSEDNKAYVGYVFEKNILGYNPNSTPEKDIPHLGLEFKSTPVK
jgi:DNA mismatch repair protein MutH